jgi:hypothetical protein
MSVPEVVENLHSTPAFHPHHDHEGKSGRVAELAVPILSGNMFNSHNKDQSKYESGRP